MVALEQLPVRARLVEVALQVGVRRELHQIAVSGVRFREQRQVVVELLASFSLATGVVEAAAALWSVEARVRRHVRLDANDRRDALRFALRVEVEDPVHVPVVGDRERRLVIGDGRVDEVGDAGRAVEHRELGVLVEVDE